MADYQTPRMLGATVRALRTHRQIVDPVTGKKKIRPQGDVAKAFCKDTASISRTEARKINIDYHMLDMYQCYFGVPNGILLCISQIAAITRDLTTAKTSTRRALEKKRLALFAEYLRNLANRIEKPGEGEQPLDQYPDLNAKVAKSWKPLIFELFAVTQNYRDLDKPTVFQDLVRLKEIGPARREMNGEAPVLPSRKRGDGTTTPLTQRRS